MAAAGAGITRLGFTRPFSSRRLQQQQQQRPHEAFGGSRGRETEVVCGVGTEPQLRIGPPDPHPYIRSRQMCLEEEYFGKMPPVCDARIPLPDIPYHGNSVQTFSWMKRLGKVPKAPNTLYREPLTTSQQYGWWLPRHPEERLEVLEPWTRTPRKPLIQSEMTKFLGQMLRTDPGFWLF